MVASAPATQSWRGHYYIHVGVSVMGELRQHAEMPRHERAWRVGQKKEKMHTQKVHEVCEHYNMQIS